MTIEEYDILFRAQGSFCAICGDAQAGGKALAVDHDHRSGKIRGLLCARCNPMLGYAKDRIDVLTKAISYLTRSLP